MLISNERLFRKLEMNRTAALIAIEAPAGYGKTTVAQQFLDSSEEPLFWYTAVEAVPDTSFRWFIRQIAQVDEKAADRLSALGFLNRSNADEAGKIISEIRASSPITLVFDNFQFSLSNWQPQILASLARQPQDGIHTIFLTQNFGRLRKILVDLEESICFIRGTELLLTEKDIRNYAESQDLSISCEEIHQISKKSEGWAAAVSLYLGGATDDKNEEMLYSYNDMNTLLDDLLWRKLSPRQQEMLLMTSFLDKLSSKDAVILFPSEEYESDEWTGLLWRIPLIRYQEFRKEWYPHELLLSFLRVKLKEKDDDFKRKVRVRSGRISEKNGMLRDAVSCYYHAGDTESLLAMRLSGLITESFEGIPYTELAKKVLNETPEVLLRKYPLSVLRLCYALYGGCAFEEFDRQMERFRKFFEDESGSQLSDESGSQLSDADGRQPLEKDSVQPLDGDHRQLLGEWYLVSALSDFPDIAKMHEKYRQAEELLERPSEIFVREEPFMFGCTSMWYLFFSEPGTMIETADRFADMMQCYNRLTNGHGSGAAELYRGEAYSVQGRFGESDIEAYQAAFLSEQSGNSTVTYGAALLLGINAIYSSDMQSLKKAIDYLENKAQGYAFLKGKMLNTYMVETVRGYLLGLMMETSRSALWTQGESDSLTDLTFTNFMVKTCRITDLLLKKEYKQAIASVETSLLMDKRLISVPTKNFMYCGLALCYMAVGRLIKASEYLDRSLTLAGQDRNYTFLACFRKYFQVLFLMPNIAKKHAKTIREIKALDINYTRADESHIFSMLEEDPEWSDLTEREREVAELAAKGLRNHEIAEKLFISENTVKHHLKIIFQKLEIDRRSKLVDMLK